jgi:outer membrane murein-binding lipoprotein Lpp
MGNGASAVTDLKAAVERVNLKIERLTVAAQNRRAASYHARANELDEEAADLRLLLAALEAGQWRPTSTRHSS